MSQYTRHIDVNQNLVYFDPENTELSIEKDCSVFSADNISFICEEDGQMWLEHKPFEGRVFEFDKEPIEQFFEEAKQQWIVKNDYEMSQIDVTPMTHTYDALVALNSLGHATAYDQWVASTDRTFIEKAFFAHAIVWRKDDQPVLDLLNSFGITSDEQLNEFFELANSL